MQRKRLMFYINTLGTGGAERVMTQLANRFSAEQYEVMLAVSFPVAEEYSLTDRVKKVYLEEEKLEQSRLMRNITRIRKLRALCKDFKPDVLIAFMAEPNFRAILATIGLPVKTVVSVRNDPKREYAGKVGRFVGKYLLPMADGCVFQTEQAKAWFPKRLQKKSTIIMNAVAESFFEIKREDPKDIVAIGRLSKQKNHDMLIRAFAKITDKHPKENLQLYGKGDLEEHLRQLISELGLENRVFLKGATDNVPLVLKNAGIFVLPSDYEGMPNALLEAMAAGVPSISTDCPCGSPAMLIRQEENGLLVPVGGENAMADAMDRLLADVSFANALGKMAKTDAEMYRPENVFKLWRQYVESLLKCTHK